MSFYELFYQFYATLFENAPQASIESWCPLLAMLSVVGFVFVFFVALGKAVFKR